MADDDPLAELIEAVADGTLERGRLPGSHQDPTISQLLAELQILAGVSEVHCSQVAGDEPTTATIASDTAVHSPLTESREALARGPYNPAAGGRMSDATSLLDRALRMHRRLVLLQSLFESSPKGEDGCPASDETIRSQALTAAIREILDGLAEDAQTLTTVPSPLSQWRPGDASGDERWRPITELERRDVLALVASCEHLVSWGESFTQWASGGRVLALTGTTGPRLATSVPTEIDEAREMLKAERARLDRLRHEMGFLERRRPSSQPVAGPR